MNVFLIVIAVVWVIRIFGNVLTYVQLWWVKEYRFDRMLVHLRTHQGRHIFFPPWRRPPVTPKTLTLTFASLALLAILFFRLHYPTLVTIALVDLISFPITGLLVAVMTVPTKIYHVTTIKRAVQKLWKHPHMLVVGITGSYGKTSVKDYLSTILATKYKVLKTEASKNSPIGIAEVVLKSLKPEHEIFVVEMGAYKRGEIATMVRMVRPQIGIITAINPQHQDLFGTIENTMKAKYELIAGLAGSRIAIMNADDGRVRQMGEWAKRDRREVWWWSTLSNTNTFFAKEIKTTVKRVEFQCVYGNQKAKVVAPVLGEHQVGNILGAIAGAVAAGMPFKDAVKAASTITPAKKVLELIPGINGSTFIDDTFNNNPDAAKAALSFLNKSKGKKIFVFQPMIELGNFSETSHEEVGELAGRICDVIILTNKNFNQSFVAGVRKVSRNVPVTAMGPSNAAAFIKKQVHKRDIVLFKGKEAAHVLNILTR